MTFFLYGVDKGVVCGLVFAKGLAGCFKIIYTSPELLEYHPCAILKVYIDGWVQLCVNSDIKLGRHCVKEDYVHKGFIIK